MILVRKIGIFCVWALPSLQPQLTIQLSPQNLCSCQLSYYRRSRIEEIILQFDHSMHHCQRSESLMVECLENTYPGCLGFDFDPSVYFFQLDLPGSVPGEGRNLSTGYQGLSKIGAFKFPNWQLQHEFLRDSGISHHGNGEDREYELRRSGPAFCLD